MDGLPFAILRYSMRSDSAGAFPGGAAYFSFPFAVTWRDL